MIEDESIFLVVVDVRFRNFVKYDIEIIEIEFLYKVRMSWRSFLFHVHKIECIVSKISLKDPCCLALRLLCKGIVRTEREIPGRAIHVVVISVVLAAI
jgi:hypothetical protein